MPGEPDQARLALLIRTVAALEWCQSLSRVAGVMRWLVAAANIVAMAWGTPEDLLAVLWAGGGVLQVMLVLRIVFYRRAERCRRALDEVSPCKP